MLWVLIRCALVRPFQRIPILKIRFPSGVRKILLVMLLGRKRYLKWSYADYCLIIDK